MLLNDVLSTAAVIWRRMAYEDDNDSLLGMDMAYYQAEILFRHSSGVTEDKNGNLLGHNSLDEIKYVRNTKQDIAMFCDLYLCRKYVYNEYCQALRTGVVNLGLLVENIICLK